MEELFYSEVEKIAFYIPSAYLDNSRNVQEIINTFTKHTAKFLKQVPLAKKANVKTYHILKSSKYKHMRVFYVETDTCPANAFVIGKENGWTMDKWINS